jgi:orotidine-5'-phosphate decarboxylase
VTNARTNFTQRLRAAQRRTGSLLCIGLDTDRRRVPAVLASADDPLYEFNRRIIEATKDAVCAYKINLAFYEATGERGWSTVRRTLADIPGEIITIGDAKRGDIGNTAAMYARALLEGYGFAACTVNPYMGFDSVEPFLQDRERGAFVLALTSNPGARDFQRLKVGARPLYECVVRRVRSWNTRRNLGLVVGATHPRELQRIRILAPELPILVPGIGTQGGNVRAAVHYGCDRHGELAVINASRSILYASCAEDFAERARAEALALREEINRAREEFF